MAGCKVVGCSQEHVESLGGAERPSELTSKIWSLKTAVGSGMPFTQGSVWQHGLREDLAREWGGEPRT